MLPQLLQSINPVNQKLLAEYACHTSSELEEIVTNASNAQKDWAKSSISARALVLTNVAKILRAKKPELAKIIALEMGKILPLGEGEIEWCAVMADYYAANAEKILADEYPSKTVANRYVKHEAAGIVLGITPWNFPFSQCFRFIIPAIMGGNATILKHAPNVTGASLEVEKIMLEAGLPHSVSQSVKIPVELVSKLIADPRINIITVTGSERTGRAVAEQAGRHLKKVVLELGGSDPFIVFDDFDTAAAVQAAYSNRISNAGQVCNSAKRFIVHSSVYDSFVNGLAGLCSNTVVGNPLETTTQMGPLARKDLLDNLMHQVDRSISEGAKLVLAGGHLPEDIGNFYRPAILANLTPDNTALCEELFGPVFSVVKFDSDDEAITLANSSRYGLGSSIWTSNQRRAERFINEIQAGVLNVNSTYMGQPEFPFGGVKCSGFGRKFGVYGAMEFLSLKNVTLPLSGNK